LRIAVIGSRGIPARYGGFETFVGELAPRLVDLGHDVTVYCRAGYAPSPRPSHHRGVTLIYTPYLRSRSLETLSHELTSIGDSLRRSFDVYYILGTRSAPVDLLAKLSRRPVLVHTDGIEWRRRKWGSVGRSYLRFAEWLSQRVVADELVTDAGAMRSYYLGRYRRSSVVIPYGAEVLEGRADPTLLSRYGLRESGYHLVVCRLEPENNVDLIIDGFERSGSTRTLAIVGAENYRTPFTQTLRARASDSTRFLGRVYGEELTNLRLGATSYLHGHEVGGTNPSLLEAMGAGNCCLALDTPFNREVLAGNGITFTRAADDVAQAIRRVESDPDEAARLGAKAQKRIAENYDWDRVAADHGSLFRELVGSG
jgi:glycosyltransferase involved in cell wall biosynthesis